MSALQIAQIVFFASYFASWLVQEAANQRATWYTVSAIAALVIALILVVSAAGSRNQN